MFQETMLPDRLAQLLQGGTPAILATYGSDGWPNAVMTWALRGRFWSAEEGHGTWNATQF